METIPGHCAQIHKDKKDANPHSRQFLVAAMLLPYPYSLKLQYHLA